MQVFIWSLMIVMISFLVVFLTKIMTMKEINEKPYMMAILSVLFVIISFATAFLIFRSEIGIATVAISSLLVLPYVLNVLDKHNPRNKKLDWLFFTRHEKPIQFYVFLFFGMALGYAVLFSALPPAISDNLFGHQIQFLGHSGPGWENFSGIIFNNIQIIIICFALSFFYGTGSVFILNYNASITGIIYGATFKSFIWMTPVVLFNNPVVSLPHTILEIVGYLLAAIGGGIMIKDYDNMKIISKDALMFFGLAVLLILLAGYVEVNAVAWFGGLVE